MPRKKYDWVAVDCTLSKGLFPSERAFEITLANGEMHSGPAPVAYCYGPDRTPLKPEQALTEEIRGLVAARFMREEKPGVFAVEVPDGEVLAVKEGFVSARPHPPVGAASA